MPPNTKIITKAKCECGEFLIEGIGDFLFGALLCPVCNVTNNKKAKRGKINGSKKSKSCKTV